MVITGRVIGGLAMNLRKTNSQTKCNLTAGLALSTLEIWLHGCGQGFGGKCDGHEASWRKMRGKNNFLFFSLSTPEGKTKKTKCPNTWHIARGNR